jgi:tryptophan 7-halogenase
LESTAIQTAVQSIMILCRLMPFNVHDEVSIAGMNKEIAVNWDTFRWFLGMHYRFNKKIDSPFWKWNNENVNIGHAAQIISLFKDRPPLSAGNFGSNSPYTAYEPLVFNSYSYDSLLFGQRLLEKVQSPPPMSKKEYFSRVEAYQALTENSLSLFELFEGDLLNEAGLLEQLFGDNQSWITEINM